MPHWKRQESLVMLLSLWGRRWPSVLTPNPPSRPLPPHCCSSALHHVKHSMSKTFLLLYPPLLQICFLLYPCAQTVIIHPGYLKVNVKIYSSFLSGFQDYCLSILSRKVKFESQYWKISFLFFPRLLFSLLLKQWLSVIWGEGTM